MSDIYEINDPTQLSLIRTDWDRLLGQTEGADFFRTLDWLETYWRHHGQNQRLRIQVIREAGQTIGILPLVVRSDQTRMGTFRALTYPLDDWGSFYGPVGPCPQEIVLTALRNIARTRCDWDYVELRWMETDALGDEWPARAMRDASFEPIKRAQDTIARIDLSPTWDEYNAALGKRWRANCRRNERRLAEVGPLRYVRYRPEKSSQGQAEPRWDLFDDCMHIAQRSWQSASTSGTTLCHEAIGPFLRDMHETAARTGGLDLNLLYVGDRPAAFNYAYYYRGYVSALRMGFDPDFRDRGAGTVLTYRILQDSFDRGDRFFDFLVGSIDLKRKWQPDILTSYRYGYLPTGIGRVQLLRLKRWLWQEKLPVHIPNEVAVTT